MTARRVLGLQAGYYLATGAWAVVHRDSFERVTGRKTDYWLVRTVGALAVAVGAALAVGARRSTPSAESVALAVGAGVAFSAADVVGVAAGRIRPVYLGDTAMHTLLAVLALAARRRPGAPA